MSSVGERPGTKEAWRRTLLEQRDATAETTRSAENDVFRSAVVDWVGRHGIKTVGAYVPVGSEPGSTDLLDALRGLGCRVLLPIVVRRDALDWAQYDGIDSLRPATFGLLEPAGTRLGADAIARADGLLVPALAVDRRGVRLGRGAGYYDRSLAKASADAALLAIVRDDELVDELPSEDHDVRVTAVLTPGRGVVDLPM